MRGKPRISTRMMRALRSLNDGRERGTTGFEERYLPKLKAARLVRFVWNPEHGCYSPALTKIGKTLIVAPTYRQEGSPRDCKNTSHP